MGGDKGNLAPHEQHCIFNSAQTIAVTQKQETRHKDGGDAGAPAVTHSHVWPRTTLNKSALIDKAPAA